MALHKDLSGADLHEPKGIEGATPGTVYVSSGGGSGSWRGLDADQVLITNKIESENGEVVIPASSTLESALKIILDFIDPEPETP